MIAIIDNYDSFTYNLAQYFGALGAEIEIFRNDCITLADLKKRSPDQLVISPGPGEPDSAGISLNAIASLGPTIPTLGVCLGHQAIGAAYGCEIQRAEIPMHGKTSLIQHSGDLLFRDLPSPFTAMRYHSLIVPEPLPECLEATAFTPGGELMGLRHREYPVYGVQFHPESILTQHGKDLLKNFLSLHRN